MSKFPKFLIIIGFLVGILLIAQQVLSQEWRPVRGGLVFGISGMALLQQQSNSLDLLIVHDNKEKEQGRLAIVTIKDRKQPEYLPLNWPSNIELPSDLEALTTVPGKDNLSFMALSSGGKAYHFRLDGENKIISVFKVLDLPSIPEKSNFEGFGLQEIEGNLLAVWAHRGGGEDSAKIYWGTLDLNTYKIEGKGSIDLKVPWPISPYVRHISDLKIDRSGVLFITSATDPGNDGPFQSAVYVAGAFEVSGNGILFRQNSQLFPIYRYKYHKIEAIELVPGAAGGVIVGTDDENMGSSVYFP